MNSFFFLSPLMLQRAIWHTTRVLLRFFCAFEIRGLNNLLPELSNKIRSYLIAKRGVIFAANHSSELDPILVPAALPFSSPLLPIFYVSRPRVFYKTSGCRQFLYGGFFFKLWGAHAASAGFKDYEKSLAAHLEILQHGGSVLIFPEGRKTRDGTIGTEAHGGVAFLARATGAPVVPIRIAGAFNMTLGDFCARRRKIAVVFGTPRFLTRERNANFHKDAMQVLSDIRAIKEL